MGIHELTTGLNGAGKTLYTVAEKLRPLVGKTFTHKGVEQPIRLVVGGIKELRLPHEIMDVQEIDPESWVDEWAKEKREPDTPAREDVLHTVFNWWLWCKPGDVIVIDECQRVFRPMASGRRIPMFINKLETARHYGVQFRYITQHPDLIHTNVRKLVGPIEDVSRVFGSSRTLVRQWDRIGDYGKLKAATTRFWKHDKTAFQLYKSAAHHAKFGAKIPLAVWACLAGVVALAGIGYYLKERLAAQFAPPKPPTAQVAEKNAATGLPGALPVPAARVVFPMLSAVPVQASREPYEGRGLQIEGQWSVGGVVGAMFGIVIDGERVATASLAQIVRMGYSWTDLGPCSGILRHGQVERVITCGKPSRVEPRKSEAYAQNTLSTEAPITKE